ncbi:MAG: MBL fold metallo-hydrolase [Planctomycetota bacterium]
MHEATHPGARTAPVPAASPVQTLWDLAGDASPLTRVLPTKPKPVRAVSATRSSLVVLASGSSGNCSALVHGEGRNRRVTLIDAGLSPARTKKLLATMDLTLERVDEVVFTHLDADHAHKGWIKALPDHARFWMHRRHRSRAGREGFLRRKTNIFETDAFELSRGVTVAPTLLAHDQLGVAAFRFEWGGERAASLGYATDLGRITPQLVESLRGVDVLAIESNYCPVMQNASDRPAFLKDRIMNGAGHLSNEECKGAVSAIAPRREVVLIHLSRQCNTPELASRYHAGMHYRLTVSAPDTPTRPIPMAI